MIWHSSSCVLSSAFLHVSLQFLVLLVGHLPVPCLNDSKSSPPTSQIESKSFFWKKEKETPTLKASCGHSMCLERIGELQNLPKWSSSIFKKKIRSEPCNASSTALSTLHVETCNHFGTTWASKTAGRVPVQNSGCCLLLLFLFSMSFSFLCIPNSLDFMNHASAQTEFWTHKQKW